MKTWILSILLIGILNLTLQLKPLIEKRDADISSENVQLFEIISKSYKNTNIEINYPSIELSFDIEKQNKINEMFVKEAFKELNVWLDEEISNLDDIALFIDYNTLFQSSNYLCVNFTGYMYMQNASYPRNLFSTVNVDITNGLKLQLSDIIDINHAFINLIRDYLKLYIDNDLRNDVSYTNQLQTEDYDIVYQDVLNNSDGYFFTMFKQADSDFYSNIFSYFTKNVFGISFATYHFAGDHFEIEIKSEDIAGYLLHNLYQQ